MSLTYLNTDYVSFVNLMLNENIDYYHEMHHMDELCDKCTIHKYTRIYRRQMDKWRKTTQTSAACLFHNILSLQNAFIIQQMLQRL